MHVIIICFYTMSLYSYNIHENSNFLEKNNNLHLRGPRRADFIEYNDGAFGGNERRTESCCKCFLSVGSVSRVDTHQSLLFPRTVPQSPPWGGRGNYPSLKPLVDICLHRWFLLGVWGAKHWILCINWHLTHNYLPAFTDIIRSWCWVCH